MDMPPTESECAIGANDFLEYLSHLNIYLIKIKIE
jgi:hypothetical protein